ncbi:MAG: hypothetical protein JWQ09_4719 [Segetibacter sp.]|nr:hypothetical protein [Segetibacter sp.]
MTANNIREKLHNFITEADDKKIEGVYLLLEDEINKEEPVRLTEEQIAILNEERRKHLKGESKSYAWEEAKEIIRANKVKA